MVLAGDRPDAPVVAAGGPLGSQLSKIRAQLVAYNAAHTTPYLGFLLSFPLPDKQKANEEAGFGVRYARKLLLVATAWS